MTSNPSIETTRGDGIDIIGMIRVVWKYRYYVAATSIVCGLLTVWYVLTVREKYRAEIVVTQVHDSALADKAGLATQIGGLASLAGVNLGANGDPSADAVLQSRHLAEEFVKKEGLVPVLTDGTGKRATLWFAVKKFQETVIKFHVEDLKELTTVSIDWFDPKVAAKWATEYVELTNDIIRARALDESTRNIAFLTKQIAETREIEIQRSLSNLLESETKTLMLANGRRDYAFRVVDPAVAPEIRHFPRRSLLSASGTALGFLLASCVVLILDAFRRRKHGQ